MARHRILIVDDDPDTRKVMSTALATRYEVVQAHDGLDALQKLEDFQPDFAIVDAMMPLMDGYQLCEAVRRHDAFKAIPVLFLSAYGSKENIRKGYAAGANLFMTKPIDPLRVLKNVDFTINHDKPGIRKKRYTVDELMARGDSPPKRETPRRSGSNGQERSRPAASSGEPSRPVAPRPAPSRPAPSPPPQSFGPISDQEEIAFEEDLDTGSVSSSPPPSPSRPDPAPRAADADPRDGLRPPLYRRPERGPVPRLMIVDNDEEIRDLMDVALRQEYEITSARDGVEAIENIVMYQPDMMIVDIMMPKMNGYQLIQTMRRNVAYQNMPILVVSGKATARDQAYVARLGGTAFVPKPFDIEQIQDKVRELTSVPEFKIGEKRLSINEIIEREYLKANERNEASEQKNKQRKFSEMQELLNEDARRRRQS
jgi:DNA-binding response OmpR family regulator